MSRSTSFHVSSTFWKSLIFSCRWWISVPSSYKTIAASSAVYFFILYFDWVSWYFMNASISFAKLLSVTTDTTRLPVDTLSHISCCIVCLPIDEFAYGCSYIVLSEYTENVLFIIYGVPVLKFYTKSIVFLWSIPSMKTLQQLRFINLLNIVLLVLPFLPSPLICVSMDSIF